MHYPLQQSAHMEHPEVVIYVDSLVLCFHHTLVGHWALQAMLNKRVNLVYVYSMAQFNFDDSLHDVWYDYCQDFLV